MRGRIRTIKPEIHLDEELWDAEEESGLPLFRAFTGLWNYADREGRFEWRPRRLKPVILPHWQGDFSHVLDTLESRGFIVKYTCNGREYGVVRTFRTHQHVNGKEPASDIPAPPKDVMRPKTSERVHHTSGAREEHVSDVPIRSLPSPDPDPVPDPDPDARAGDGSPQWDDRETQCPLDLVSKASELGVLRELSDRLRVPLVSVDDAAREFVGYWTIGEGAGKRRRNWLTKLREHVRRAQREKRLRAPGEIEHAAAGENETAADAILRKVASLPKA